MSLAEVDAPITLGFLTVVEDQRASLIGGYLVINSLGRPLEFHCTAPVRPNRAQEILYGATLGEYIYGEQIGQSLVRASKGHHFAIFTDQVAALATAQHVDQPVWLVLANDEERPDNSPPDLTTLRIDCQYGSPVEVEVVHLGRNCLAQFPMHACVPSSHANSRILTQGDAKLVDISNRLDLSEPFGRIRMAIEEAQRGGR